VTALGLPKKAIGPTSDEARVDRGTAPSDEAERTEVAVGTVSPVLASLGAAVDPEGDAALAPDDVTPATVNAEETAGGD
jgi:hypothetical protein